MSEKIVCPKCLAESIFRHGMIEVSCFWCWYRFSTSDRLHALKAITKKPFKAMAADLGWNVQKFLQISSGRFEPNFQDHEAILAYIDAETK